MERALAAIRCYVCNLPDDCACGIARSNRYDDGTAAFVLGWPGIGCARAACSPRTDFDQCPRDTDNTIRVHVANLHCANRYRTWRSHGFGPGSHSRSQHGTVHAGNHGLPARRDDATARLIHFVSPRNFADVKE